MTLYDKILNIITFFYNMNSIILPKKESERFMMEETIEIKDLLKTLRKRWGLIVLISIVTMAISAFVSFILLTPQYQATTQILVNKESKDIKTQHQDIQTDLQLINTYKVIIKSPAILNQVIEDLDLNMKASQLNGRIAVSDAENSKVMNIVVTDANPKQAVTIANSVAKVFEKEIKDMMKVDNVKILMQADLSDSLNPVNPNPKLNMAIGLVLGLMLGVGLAFLLEYFDTTFKSEKEVEDTLGFPVLGVIEVIPETGNVKTGIELQRKNRRG